MDIEKISDIVAEDLRYWQVAGDQTLLTGSKSGSFDLTTTGTVSLTTSLTVPLKLYNSDGDLANIANVVSGGVPYLYFWSNQTDGQIGFQPSSNASHWWKLYDDTNFTYISFGPTDAKVIGGTGNSPHYDGRDIYVQGGVGITGSPFGNGGNVYLLGGAHTGALADGKVYITGLVDWTGITGNIDIGSNNLTTTGAITALSYTIGANTLTTTEFNFLDGQDQSVFTTSSPTFANLVITAGGDIKPSANSTSGISVAQADGTNFVVFDSTNKSTLFTDGGITTPLAGTGISIAKQVSGDFTAIAILNSNGNDAQITFSHTTSFGTVFSAIKSLRTNRAVSTDTDIAFLLRSGGGAYAEKFRIRDDGMLKVVGTKGFYPSANSTTALGIFQADATTRWVTFDTTNKYILLDTNSRFQFRDSAIYAYSSADGWLNLVADTGAEVNAPILNVVDLYASDDIFLDDGGLLTLGTGDDMSVQYTGSVGRIDTSLVAPSDLQIDCGTDKTVVLDESVYDDLQFSVATGKAPPAGTAPTWEAFTTNTAEYAFSVDDLFDLQANELPHWWSEGTTGHMHLHFTIKTAQSTGANRYAKFTIWVAYSDATEAWVEQAPLSYEYTIPTGSAALTNFYLDMGDITLTNYLIGAQIKVRVKRIAATGGTEYADDVYITQVGCHLEKIRLGSRGETTS